MTQESVLDLSVSDMPSLAAPVSGELRLGEGSGPVDGCGRIGWPGGSRCIPCRMDVPAGRQSALALIEVAADFGSPAWLLQGTLE